MKKVLTPSPSQHSKIIIHLIQEEIKKREHNLYECALAVSQDTALSKEMVEWNITLADGVNEEI